MQVPVLSNDIDVLAHTPEGQYFDRKSARIKPNDLAKIITAMANSAGGKVALPVFVCVGFMVVRFVPVWFV